MNTETKTSITKAHPISRGRKAGKILLEGKNQKGKEKKENKTSITKPHPISKIIYLKLRDFTNKLTICNYNYSFKEQKILDYYKIWLKKTNHINNKSITRRIFKISNY